VPSDYPFDARAFNIVFRLIKGSLPLDPLVERLRQVAPHILNSLDLADTDLWVSFDFQTGAVRGGLFHQRLDHQQRHPVYMLIT
jgi:hypothetical protein